MINLAMALSKRPSELLGIKDPFEAYYFDLELLSHYYSTRKKSKTVEKIMRKRAERRRKAAEWRRRYIT